MHCIQEKDSSFKMDVDPLAAADPTTSDSDAEPDAKRPKLAYTSPSLNLQVYQIPAYNIPKSLSIFPTTQSSALPMFVNNPLNLANPLAMAANGNGLTNLHKRYSLPAKLSITPATPSNGSVRYKKNGEVAKKRGPPKGYKRKPKLDTSLPTNANGTLTPAQSALVNSLILPPPQAGKPPAAAPGLTIIPRVEVPKGVELVELELDPSDWFPEEPYKMVYSRKKNQKWKEFPYQCEFCFKGYRIASSLAAHSSTRHGAPPSAAAFPCPCCPLVATRRKQLTRHLTTHEGKRHRIFCPYCVPPADPDQPFVKESEKYPFDKFPQFWYASEESLRLHKKRKHPYAALYNKGWRGGWGQS